MLAPLHPWPMDAQVCCLQHSKWQSSLHPAHNFTIGCTPGRKYFMGYKNCGLYTGTCTHSYWSSSGSPFWATGLCFIIKVWLVTSTNKKNSWGQSALQQWLNQAWLDHFFSWLAQLGGYVLPRLNSGRLAVVINRFEIPSQIYFVAICLGLTEHILTTKK